MAVDVTKIRGKGNYLKQLDAEGFDVFIGNKKIDPGIKKEKVEALKGVGMRIEVKKGTIRPTPSGGTPLEKESGAYPEPWVVVQDATGKMLFIEDARRVVIPENVWRKYTSDQLDKKAPFSRKAESKPAFESRIPGLPVSGVGKVGKVGSSE